MVEGKWELGLACDEKPIKNLGRCYDASLKDCEQVQQLNHDVSSGLKNTPVYASCKTKALVPTVWPPMMWPLTVVDVPLTRVE